MDAKGQAQVAGNPMLALPSDKLLLQSLLRKAGAPGQYTLGPISGTGNTELEAALKSAVCHKKADEGAKRLAVETDAPVTVRWLDPSTGSLRCIEYNQSRKRQQKKYRESMDLDHGTSQQCLHNSIMKRTKKKRSALERRR